MALAKPQNLDSTYEARVGDKFCVSIAWDPVPGAVAYMVYRDTHSMLYVPPFETLHINDGVAKVVFRDTLAWTQGESLDLFYWVAALESDGNGGYIAGELSDALTNIQPFCLRIVEEARSTLGDDLRIFNDESSKVSEQISVYNYKIACDLALSDINSIPTPTNYGYGTFPQKWHSLLVTGTLVWILPRLILFEQAKQMKFGDEGKEWTPPDLSAVLEKMRDMYKDLYEPRKEAIKHNVKPMPRAVGSLKALFISPQMLKWRHVPTGRPSF